MEVKNNQFDFSRNDKFFSLTVPSYSSYDDVVLYEFQFKDLITNMEYVHFFRFKELKEIHDSLSALKLQLPEFPKTHFWRKTNKNPELINERKVKLQYYFQIVLNDPCTRGCMQIKKLIKKMKSTSRHSQRFSSPPGKSIFTQTTRSQSLSQLKKNVNIQQLKNQLSNKKKRNPN